MTLRVVDLFAGCGGSSEGARQAGARVLWAANHWQAAVEVHAANHPDTEHSCQDLQQADWRQVPDHDLLWASPACQGHSQAGQPGRTRPGVEQRQQMDRNTAWAVVSCAEVKRPRTILVENISDFLRWPLLPAWESALEILGYHVTRHRFDAADFGTPQNRERAILSARLDAPLVLAAEDGRPMAPDTGPRPHGRCYVPQGPPEPRPGFGTCIDWDQGPWFAVSSKTPGVQRRVRAGRERIGRPRFLTHHVTGHRGRELERPVGCITTKDQWAVVDGDQMRMLSLLELRRAMDLDDRYQLPETRRQAVRMLGNGIPVRMARSLVRQVQERESRDSPSGRA